jgi:hypothetical protein
VFTLGRAKSFLAFWKPNPTKAALKVVKIDVCRVVNMDAIP